MLMKDASKHGPGGRELAEKIAAQVARRPAPLQLQ